MAFLEEGEVDAEAGVGGFGAGDGLEEEIEGRTLLDCCYLGGDVGEDAVLRGDGEAFADGVDHAQEAGDYRWIVAGGVYADDGVSRAEEQAIEDGGGDAGWIVGGVVGLETRGETAVESDGSAKARDVADTRGDEDEILNAHELADRGCHLGREAGGEGSEAVGGCVFGKKPIAEFSYGEGGDWGESCCVMRVDDEARNFVGFVGEKLDVEEVL